MLPGENPRRRSSGVDGPCNDKQQFSGLFTVPSHFQTMESQERTPKTRWSTELYDFSQNTTIHALKQITEPTPFCFRRVIWLMLLVLGLVLFILQVVQSVIYYWSNPVAVNININYNDTLRFPAITICNQNAFRMTEAYDRGYYQALNALFSSSNGIDISSTNVSHLIGIPHNELLMQLSHRKEDFIVSCSWARTPCVKEEIKLTITDYGVCYTFNAGDYPVKQVSQTGAQWGLRLQLNLEQYEYMAGPTSGAGVRVLVHEQGDVAEVSEQGQAIPPGSHGFIGITIVQIDDLEPPYGKCQERIELEHFAHYTQAACYSVCVQKKVESHCQCSYNFDNPFEEADHVDEAPPCSLGEYLNCALPYMHSLRDLHKICTCPHSCHRTHFETAATYGATSNFDMSEIVHKFDQKELRKKYHKAREIRQFVDPYIRSTDISHAEKLLQYVDSLDHALVEIPNKLDELSSTFQKEAYTLRKRVNFHYDRGITNVKYVIEHDFIRGWQILEERTFGHVATGFWENIASFDRVISFLKREWKNKDVDYRIMGWYGVDDQLSVRQKRAMRAQVNLTEVDEAYRTGKPLLKFLTTIDRRYDLLYIPKHLLTHEAESQLTYYTKANESLIDFIVSIDRLREYGTLIANKTDVGNESIGEVRTDFIAAAKQINYRFFQFKTVVLMKPVELIDDIISKFLDKNATLTKEFVHFQTAVASVKVDIKRMRNVSWELVKELTEYYYKYSHTEVGRNMSKFHLAMTFNSKKMVNLYLEIQHFFTSLRSRAREIQDSAQRLRDLHIDIFQSMVNEESTKRFYAKITEDFKDFKDNNNTDFIRIFAYMLRIYRSTVRKMPLDVLERRLNADFIDLDLAEKTGQTMAFFDENINPETDILGLINNKDEELFVHVNHIQTLMEQYIREHDIGFQFFRENYLNVDVYMRDLSYENISHQKAYDLVSLWSDIGGSVGLFVGASALSLFEILDIFLHTALKIGIEKSKHKRKANKNPDDNKKFQETGLMM